jgi:AraC-like DNA-binding protein
MVVGARVPDSVATVSLRWLLPFLRVSGVAPGALSLPTQEGVAPVALADPRARVRHAAFVRLIEQLEKQESLPGLGLRAGDQLEVNELGVFGHALRSCGTLRTAIAWASRYVRLVHGSLEFQLLEDGQLARWELRVIDHVPQPAALNEFWLAAALSIATQLTGVRPQAQEVHFKHASVPYPLAYKRAFGQAVLRFGERRNALVFPRACLDSPVVLAHPTLLRACEAQADALLEDLYRSEGTRGRVRQLLLARLNQTQPSFGELAQELALNRSTLRARLRAEGTTYSEILQEVRFGLAEQYLTDLRLGMAEISALIGFSQVSTFYRAFRRWQPDTTPREFRELLARRAHAPKLDSSGR